MQNFADSTYFLDESNSTAFRSTLHQADLLRAMRARLWPNLCQIKSELIHLTRRKHRA
jgi:hypothetical protein